MMKTHEEFLVDETKSIDTLNDDGPTIREGLL